MTAIIKIIAPPDQYQISQAKKTLINIYPGAVFLLQVVDSSLQYSDLVAMTHGQNRYTQLILLFRLKNLKNCKFFVISLFVMIGLISAFVYIQKNGRIYSRGEIHKELFLLPLAPFLLLIKLPVYFCQQLIRNFISTKENPGDIFVGFGKEKKIGGVLYWLIYPPKIRRYGLFGLAHENYWGMPLGIHSWPLSVFLLEKLGYRRFIYLATGLLTLGMAWFAIESGHSWLTLLLPLILTSNYFLFNLYVGTWELLSWGWGMLAFSAFQAQNPEVSGLLLGFCLLSHPGVVSLIGLIIGLYAFLAMEYSIADILLVRLGIVGGLLSLWWLIPYFRSRKFIGRDVNINIHWQKVRSWTISTAYQFILSSSFAIVAMFSSGRPMLSLLLLLPPIIIFYNIKIRWVYSQYTTINFFIVVGCIFLEKFPSIFGWTTFIFILYTSTKLIWSDGKNPYQGYDLTPVVLGKRRSEILDAFNNVDGRVGLEMEFSMEAGAWRYAPAIGFMLADTHIDLVNVAYSQIGDSRIIEKYCQYFNQNSQIDTFQKACVDCGVDFMIAFTSDFCQYLQRVGSVRISKVESIHLSDNPADAPVDLNIYRLPWKASRIIPEVELIMDKNRISFQAAAGQTYTLKYSAFPGWRASQQGKHLPIKDANPGIQVLAVKDGLLELKYSLRNYWSL